MRKLLFIAAAVGSLAVPAMAEEVGVGVGPVGAWPLARAIAITIGTANRDRTTVIKEREPVDRTTVVKKEHDDGVETKTIIHHDD
jgi:L-alanine-DL-glutamate epimerase-like enolase superfamily enzyme